MKNRVKQFRIKNNWTQDDLAKRIKCSRQTISLIERNHLLPSTILALKIANLFSVSIEELFILENME
ncbi:helix-turn-helix transcriptional regulator [Staphylococcus saprophyticus]|uniref:helix-turn-helix transcriptional regulator n=1 Tax=Staphylococcus saprophyticus TaxID=29385 RepID=UPI000D1F4814|nr:helix-turn-helix transcriptional regulator [Staphylococcus saprophyticus]PTJ62443.1 transcriptional regulator [Staphylococcus saprophyticus]RIO40354.1 transcriptional regulator [Staphylococcus saprophyticus]